MTADTLRASIEAALRQRDPSSVVELRPIGGCVLVCLDSDLTTGSTQHIDPVEALRRLARGHGLLVSDDGTVTDALEEVVRITRHYAKQLAVWDRDKTAEADRLSAEGDALREDNARLTRERDEARDALQAETQRLESLWAAVRELREALAASSVASAEMDHANRRELHGAITLEEYGAIGVAFGRAVARADAADAAIRALTEAP